MDVFVRLIPLETVQRLGSETQPSDEIQNLEDITVPITFTTENLTQYLNETLQKTDKYCFYINDTRFQTNFEHFTSQNNISLEDVLVVYFTTEMLPRYTEQCFDALVSYFFVHKSIIIVFLYNNSMIFLRKDDLTLIGGFELPCCFVGGYITEKCFLFDRTNAIYEVDIDSLYKSAIVNIGNFSDPQIAPNAGILSQKPKTDVFSGLEGNNNLSVKPNLSHENSCPNRSSISVDNPSPLCPDSAIINSNINGTNDISVIQKNVLRSVNNNLLFEKIFQNVDRSIARITHLAVTQKYLVYATNENIFKHDLASKKTVKISDVQKVTSLLCVNGLLFITSLLKRVIAIDLHGRSYDSFNIPSPVSCATFEGGVFYFGTPTGQIYFKKSTNWLSDPIKYSPDNDKPFLEMPEKKSDHLHRELSTDSLAEHTPSQKDNQPHIENINMSRDLAKISSVSTHPENKNHLIPHKNGTSTPISAVTDHISGNPRNLDHDTNNSSAGTARKDQIVAPVRFVQHIAVKDKCIACSDNTSVFAQLIHGFSRELGSDFDHISKLEWMDNDLLVAHGAKLRLVKDCRLKR